MISAALLIGFLALVLAGVGSRTTNFIKTPVRRILEGWL
jgi:hypothetical protein